MTQRWGAVADAAAVGVFGVLWYGMPDVVRTRRARVPVKAALVAGYAAYAWGRRDVPGDDPVARVAAADGQQGGEPADAPRPPASTGSTTGLSVVASAIAAGPAVSPADLGLPVDADGRFAPRQGRAGRIGLAVAVAGLSVLFESALHRGAIHLGRRGVRSPHTRVGVVMGLASAASTYAVDAIGQGRLAARSGSGDVPAS
ncbi:hypothetical protein [Cellulomonas chengniuliangii]|uniref:Uncharacterized protein n=1 Tax=Cellulomonas chengniuliangii TaxID=2968084 RepID=A0ABY5L375_9CELL|nr:hypothetical protein [Cellulomonas chengniuliangii]MCC2308103.1 hypothetical protein [Cellulomonas chengniuliangii]MCC2318324.1 hypothetical protein [Cellulomonas chengniuliangii]UUI76498.1 hypothetical protein NP064_06325 [Cellulomonas chengniuliangii]